MNRYFVFALAFILFCSSIVTGVVASPPLAVTPTPQPISTRIATLAELQKAKSEWSQSAHADTYDQGMGANTTCARCKSPFNWDVIAPAADQALDCFACKRIPGAPRPELESGAPVLERDWKNIGCEVCHRPVGNSYETALAFWNNAAQSYEPIQQSTELCAKCHEGRHGFEVIEEQHNTQAHRTMECTQCHGAHGSTTQCTDCHDPQVGKGAAEHAQHPRVDCTACHDAGNLNIWQESNPNSRHYQKYIPVRFAHALTSWPSHNLATVVDCRRCHHPQGLNRALIVPTVGCDNQQCHSTGAVLNWCPTFVRNVPPSKFTPSKIQTAAHQNAIAPAVVKSGTLSLAITSPAERETFYVGPESLLHSARIVGWVVDGDRSPIWLELKLEILRGTTVIDTVMTKPQLDGAFFFDVEVNPDGLSGNWIVEHTDCTNCHYDSDVSLVPGAIALRVTAIAPGNRTVTTQRNIVVDYAGYATVPVRVVRADAPNQVVPGIKIDGVTWLYLWRARSFAGITDTNGETRIRVEALAQAPTEYQFSVKPTIVDGILYEGVAPVTLTLPAGATTAPPITLQVRSRIGQLTGKLNGNLKSPVDIRAIRLPDGTSFKAQTAQNEFVFDKLPIDRFIVVVDANALAAQGWQSKPQIIDLTESISAQLEIPLRPLEGKTVRGTIRDTERNPVPFASIANSSVLPTFGEFRLRDVPTATKSLTVSAPGFYSQIVPLTELSSVEVMLVRRPETRLQKWGAGEIIIPSESTVNIQDHMLALERGWLWGRGGDQQPLVLRIGGVQIEIVQGQFALEHIPGQSTWFYLIDGKARVTQGNRSMVVQANQMLALSNEMNSPIDLDTVVIEAMHTSEGLMLDPVWEPTLSARVQNDMARAGIGAVQTFTFITYSAVIILLLGLPVVVSWRWRKNHPTG